MSERRTLTEGHVFRVTFEANGTPLEVAEAFKSFPTPDALTATIQHAMNGFYVGNGVEVSVERQAEDS